MPRRSWESWIERNRSSKQALGYVSGRASAVAAPFEQAEAIERTCTARRLHLTELVWDLESPSASSQTQRLKYTLDRLVSSSADALVVAHLVALGGSAANVGQVVRWCDDRGIRLIAEDLGLDTATRSGRLATRAVISAGQLEHVTLGQSTRRGLADARQKGTTMGRPSVADRPALLERIVELRYQGLTLQAIADQLNADGVSTLRGGAKWRPSSVQAAVGYTRPARRWRNGDTQAGEVL
jgi:DNA invertase Pin-like site-specific DNA recombinase